MADWRIERLVGSHERGEFCCGKAPLDEFLRSLVSQYEKRNLGRTYVAVAEGERRVYGYYTLASSAVAFAQVPPKIARKLPRHPVPVALLARLAVDRAAQGQGLGVELLMDALRRCRELAAVLGIFAVEVLAIDDEARRFYEKYGFTPLLDDERHLYLTVKTLESTLGKETVEE
jgi:GNAT superfamily N-acetyltransferase